jgi:hypothetical protein
VRVAVAWSEQDLRQRKDQDEVESIVRDHVLS